MEPKGSLPSAQDQGKAGTGGWEMIVLDLIPEEMPLAAKCNGFFKVLGA